MALDKAYESTVASTSSGLFNTNIRKTNTDDLTAGTTQTQAGATQLTADINRITTVAVNDDGVKMPFAAAGLQVLLLNRDITQRVQVWPNTSDRIDNNASNNVDPNPLGAGSSRTYVCFDNTVWRTV